MTEYIEREKAFDAVFGQFCASSDETEAALNAAIDEIKAIPAADVRPVVRGKCTDEARYFFCSECGYGVQDVFEGNYSDKNEVLLFERGKGWNFCPNCGAMMEES